jgi:PAS domain S-box-containing protein
MVSDPHTLLSASPHSELAEIICVLNANGAIQFATPAAAQFFGYDMSAIIGRSALRFVAPDNHHETLQRWAAMRDNPANTRDQMHLTMLAANGRRVPIQATVWRLPHHEGFLLVLHLVEYLQDRLQTLYSILNNVSGRLAVSAVLDTVQREVFRLIPSSVCTVFLIENDTVVRVREWNQIELRERRVPLGAIFRFETTQTICETGRPVIITDTTTDPRGLALEDASPDRTIRSWLGVPLIHHDQFLGELHLDSPQPAAFTHQDAELALALAGQLASVVFHARQFEAEQRRSKRYRVLNDISQAISRLDLGSVLELVYRNLSQLIDTSTFFIGLYDAEAETVQLVGAYDHGQKSPDVTQRANEGITGQVLRTRTPLIVQNSDVEGLPKGVIVQNEIPRSLLMMPLITQDELVGVISVQSYESNAYTPDDVEMLDTIAGAVATAVRNARLYDQTVERFAALGTLHQMGLELATAQEPGEIAQRVTQAALNLLKSSAVRLCVCDDPQHNRTTIWSTYARGSAYPAADPGPVRVESCSVSGLHPLVIQVRDTAQSVLIMDMASQPVLQREFDTPWLVQAAAI